MSRSNNHRRFSHGFPWIHWFHRPGFHRFLRPRFHRPGFHWLLRPRLHSLLRPGFMRLRHLEESVDFLEGRPGRSVEAQLVLECRDHGSPDVVVLQLYLGVSPVAPHPTLAVVG